MKNYDLDEINHDIVKLVLNDITALPEDELCSAIDNTLVTLLEGQDSISELLTCSYADAKPTAYKLANIGALQSFITSLTISLLKVKDGALYRKIHTLESRIEQA